MRVVFMGTPEFALTSLKAIYDAGHDIALVVSQPDKPSGRGYALTPSPVKKFALEKGIEVVTPASMRTEEADRLLRSVNADVFVVAAFGKILPQNILDIPPHGCICVHASLLPALRGAAPINRAVMEGHDKGGITIMYMDAGIDTGDIILQRAIPIPEDMTAGEYHDKMAVLGGELITEYLSLAEKGLVTRTPQTEDGASYANKIDKKEAYEDFSRSARETHNRIRGLAPYPAAYALLNGKRIKLFASSVSDGCGAPGTVLSTEKGIEIACGEGSVIITALQPEGKGKMDAQSFLRGNSVKKGDIFNV
ncbi:MAG: methionyl-tRNA formyltransferase [Clostridia bacterium]|nr:methionyl-tRNA formyltransferase [Clostridia bacterium]